MDKKKLALVSLGHLSCDVNGGALPAVLPYLRAAHHLDYQATAGLMLAYSCLSSIIQPFFGLLADRHSKPWFIPVGIILAGCGIAAMSFVTGYWTIFAGIAISGVGAAFFHPEAARFANKVSGHKKGIGLSIFSIGGNSGFILGPLLVTMFVGTFGLYGMSVFAVLGAIMAAILFWQIFRLPTVPGVVTISTAEREASQAASDPQAAEGAELTEPAPGFTNTPQPENNWKEFSRLVICIVSRAIVFTGCNTFIPLYWVNGLNQSKAAGATALVIFGATGVAFNIIGGMLSDKVGYVRIIRLAFFFMGPAVFLFSMAGNIVAAYMLLPALALVLYLPFSSQVVLGQKLLARNIGFASGVTMGLATTLGGIAQPCLGWVADTFGLHSVFTCLASFGLLGCLFSFLLSSRYNNAAD